MAIETYYPPTGFHFKVEFDLPGIRDQDFRFQEVSGLDVEIEVETRKEGGENRFTHSFPTRAKYNNLVLKRGLLTDSALVRWCKDAIENFLITPVTVYVSLLNEEHEPLKIYTINNAWPVKWSLSAFNAEQSNIVIESIELKFQFFTIDLD